MTTSHNQPKGTAAAPLLVTTGSMRTLLPEVFYRNPTPSAVNEISAEARYLEVNDAWLTFFGLERDQVLGKALREVEIWASVEERHRLGRLLHQHPRMRDRECLARRAGDSADQAGSIADVLVSWETFEHAGRSCMLWVFTDITARAVAERRLRQSEARFEKLVESSPQPMSITRLADGVYLGINRAMEALLGYPRAEMLGKKSVELGVWVNPAVRDELRSQIAAGRELAIIETQVRAKSGALIDIQFSATVIDLDGVPVLYGTAVDLTSIKAVAREAIAAEERATQLFQASPDAIVITRLADGVYVEMNDAWEALFGYPRAATLGKSSRELGVWVEGAERDRFVDQLRQHRVVRGFETQLRHYSGKEADVVLSAEVINLGGAECVIIGTVDITDRKRAEAQRAASEDRFAKIFRTSPDAISIVRVEDGVHLEVNDAWLALYELGRSEVVGKSSLDFGVWETPADRERLVAAFRDSSKINGFEIRQRTGSGARIDVLISAERFEFDGEDAFISCGVNITERKREERLRTASETRFAQVFQASPNPIVFSRASDGRGIRVNDAWHRLFGYSAEEMHDQTSLSLNMWVEPDFRARRQKILAEGGRIRDLDTQMRAKSGAIIDVLISSETVDLDGEAHVVSIITDVSARKAADRQIEYLATRDYLTGLPNRVLFSDRLQQALVKAARENTHVALLFTDLDHFKNINDTLGHQAGDHVLVEVAARLASAVRGADTVGRQGGDEFLLLLEGLGAAEDARPVAEKIVGLLSAPVNYQGHSLKVSCSVGVSVYPDDALTEADLMRNADLAMYAAKEAGRNAFRFFTAGMNKRLVERMSLETQLREAVERGEFVLYFQPKVDFESALVTGCEALLRWRRGPAANGALLQPGRFIEVAEHSGLIVPIGAWVLRETCLTLRRWIDAGYEAVPVACNVSVHQFTPALPGQIAAVLLETGVSAHLLQLEITETVMMQNAVTHLETMRQLKELGLKIALDDFGTGYSSLSYLRHMDLDVLKIDRSFVRDVATSLDAQTIVSAIIAMAGKFGMQTVAEGVETSAQAGALRRMRCNEYQGFLFSPPVPRDQFEREYLNQA